MKILLLHVLVLSLFCIYFCYGSRDDEEEDNAKNEVTIIVPKKKNGNECLEICKNTPRCRFFEDTKNGTCSLTLSSEVAPQNGHRLRAKRKFSGVEASGNSRSSGKTSHHSIHQYYGRGVENGYYYNDDEKSQPYTWWQFTILGVLIAMILIWVAIVVATIIKQEKARKREIRIPAQYSSDPLSLSPNNIPFIYRSSPNAQLLPFKSGYIYPWPLYPRNTGPLIKI